MLGQEGGYTASVSFGDEEIRGSAFNLEVLLVKDYLKIGVDQPVEALGSPWLSCEVGQLRRPAGITYDSTGRFVFVADQSHDRVLVVDAVSCQVLSACGSKGRGSQNFNTPGYIVCDRDQQVVISDLLNHRLQVFVFNPEFASMEHVRTVGGQSTFQFPRGLALDEQGRLYVCDSGNHRVQVFDTLDNYKLVQVIGEAGDGDGQFQQPLDVAISRSNEILVADGGNRIQVFDAHGVFLRSFGKKGKKNGMFKHIPCITVDDENSVFVCDQGNNRVQVLRVSDGSFVHKWGGYSRKPVEDAEGDGNDDAGQGEETPRTDLWVGLSDPVGITLNAYGKVLVSDSIRNCIFAY